MNLPEPPDLSQYGIDLVIDTNIWFDVISIHNLVKAYDAYKGAEMYDVNAAPLVARRARAREALLLLRLCHTKQLKTFSLDKELDNITKLVPPGRQAITNQYIACFSNFILPRLLGGQFVQAGCDALIKGNKCDDFLVEMCRKNDLPLITHEGYSTRGIDHDAKIRKKARKAGVAVFTAREFWTGKLNPDEEIRFMCLEFERAAPDFIRTFEQHEHERVAYTLQWVQASLDHVLWGSTANTHELARVELPGDQEMLVPLIVSGNAAELAGSRFQNAQGG